MNKEVSYVPTEEEVQVAEEQLTPTQKLAGELREKYYVQKKEDLLKEATELGISSEQLQTAQVLETKFVPGSDSIALQTLILDGHKVEIIETFDFKATAYRTDGGEIIRDSEIVTEMSRVYRVVRDLLGLDKMRSTDGDDGDPYMSWASRLEARKSRENENKNGGPVS